MTHHHSGWQDPIVVFEDILIATKVFHVVTGIYFWEFLTTLHYEWNVIRKRIPFRWTIWIYTITRISTLLAIALTLVIVDNMSRSNCEVELVFQLFFGYLSIACASLLIVLRIVAIWNRNKIIIAIAAATWVINVIIEMQSVARVRASQVHGGICVENNLHLSELNVLVTLAADIILLLIMFFGLLRLGFHERSAFGLGRLLWKQGVIWLLVATIAEVLPAVFLCLNLNVPLDAIFLAPSMVTLSIAATRIYRSLAYHATFDNTTEQESGLGSNERNTIARIAWKARADSNHITQNQMEVATNRSSDQE